MNAPENGYNRDLSPTETIQFCAGMLSRLARQLEAHAAGAPYPHWTKRLQEVALEKQRMAQLLGREISGSVRELDHAQDAIRCGKNHWENMAQDVKDQKLLENSFLFHASRTAESAPHVSALLKKIASQQNPHHETLLDMLMRADPQANQT